MFIDVHGHVRRYPGLGLPNAEYDSCFHTVDQLLARYDEIGVRKALLLPLVSPEFYEPQSNAGVMAICREHSDRFIPFCNVDPRSLRNSPHSPFERILSRYKEQGCKGLGEITANLAFNDPMVDNLFRACEEVGLPVIFHAAATIGGAYGLYDEPGLSFLERALGTYSNLILIGHSMPFWAEIATLETPWSRMGYPDGPVKEEGVVSKLLRKYPNLYGDLSAGSGFYAISRDYEFGIAFLNEFQDRLYFGTDICTPGMSIPLPGYLLKLKDEGRISEECFEKIAWKNASRLLDIDMS